jgi:hypothetical protein
MTLVTPLSDPAEYQPERLRWCGKPTAAARSGGSPAPLAIFKLLALGLPVHRLSA